MMGAQQRTESLFYYFRLEDQIGVTGALVGLGIPEYEAKRYEGRLQRGGILLSVHCNTSEEIKRAKELLKNSGAEDISSTGESSVDSKSAARSVGND